MTLIVLCTIPLRSVSVAWTNRISPDPARTSGPSSFWGRRRTREWMAEKWGGWGWMPERIKVAWVDEEWRSLARAVALLLPLFAFLPPPLKGSHLSPSCTSSSDDEEKVKPVCDWSSNTAVRLLKHLGHNSLRVFFPPFTSCLVSAYLRVWIVSVSLALTLRTSEQHFKLRFSDCTTQDKAGGGGGGGGTGGGRLLCFIAAIPKIWLQGAAMAPRILSLDLISQPSNSQ